MTDYMTTAEAAEKWGVSRQAVLKWIQRGKLSSAQRAGHAWLIPADTPKPTDRRYVDRPVRNRRKHTRPTDTD